MKTFILALALALGPLATVELKDVKAAEHEGAEEAHRVARLKKPLAD